MQDFSQECCGHLMHEHPMVFKCQSQPQNHNCNCPHTLLNTGWEPFAVFLVTPQGRSKVTFSFLLVPLLISMEFVFIFIFCHTAGRLIHSCSLPFFSPFASPLCVFFSPSHSLSLWWSLSFPNLSVVSEPIKDKNYVMFAFVLQHTPKCLTRSRHWINVFELNQIALLCKGLWAFPIQKYFNHASWHPSNFNSEARSGRHQKHLQNF